jgi:CAP12/Pycsar effector protein, TIR domain
MLRLHTTATRLEFYLVWLALRRVTRSEDAVAEPLRDAIAVFLDRIDVLLDLDIDRDRRREIAEVLGSFRGSRLINGALRGACSRLADLLALVVSEPGVPLRRPKIDQITYIRLLQLAVQIRDHEPGAGDQLYAEQLAARSNVSLDRVHAAIARMLADGVVHLPSADDHGRADAFRMNEPAEVDKVLVAPDVEREWQPHREHRHDSDLAAPNPREVVVVHGRGTARTAFFFELLRRLNLRPLALDELVVRSGSGSPSTRELIRSAFVRAQAVIVVFTGDDLASLRPGLGGNPHPYLHVIFEAGVAVALQHARTIIVEMPPLSGLLDLADVHTVGFPTGAPEERHQLVRRLRAAGCELETEGSTWLNLEFPP